MDLADIVNADLEGDGSNENPISSFFLPESKVDDEQDSTNAVSSEKPADESLLKNDSNLDSTKAPDFEMMTDIEIAFEHTNKLKMAAGCSEPRKDNIIGEIPPSGEAANIEEPSARESHNGDNNQLVTNEPNRVNDEPNQVNLSVNTVNLDTENDNSKTNDDVSTQLSSIMKSFMATVSNEIIKEEVANTEPTVDIIKANLNVEAPSSLTQESNAVTDSKEIEKTEVANTETSADKADEEVCAQSSTQESNAATDSEEMVNLNEIAAEEKPKDDPGSIEKMEVETVTILSEEAKTEDDKKEDIPVNTDLKISEISERNEGLEEKKTNVATTEPTVDIIKVDESVGAQNSLNVESTATTESMETEKIEVATTEPIVAIIKDDENVKTENSSNVKSTAMTELKETTDMSASHEEILKTEPTKDDNKVDETKSEPVCIDLLKKSTSESNNNSQENITGESNRTKDTDEKSVPVGSQSKSQITDEKDSSEKSEEDLAKKSTAMLNKKVTFDEVTTFNEPSTSATPSKRPRRSNTVYHVEEESKNLYTCDYRGCDSSFRRKSSLTSHKKVHAEDELTCPYCQKQYVHSSRLKKHISAVHDSD